MSAERAIPARRATLLLLCQLALPGAALAADADETPDMALLEYLGSWEETDEDWVLLTDTDDDDGERDGDEQAERSDPAAGKTESQESDHED